MPDVTLARSIMTRQVTTFTPETELLEAARVLFDNGWAGAPVLDGGKLVGVITLADVIAQRREVRTPQPIILFDALLYLGSRRFAKELRKITAMNVGQAMSSPAITVGPDTVVAEVVAMMIDKALATLPVVEGGAVVGVIGRRDVVRLILGRGRSETEPGGEPEAAAE